MIINECIYTHNYFTEKINTEEIKIVFELGSRDGLDTKEIYNFYNNSKIYTFECDPNCIDDCKKNIHGIDSIKLVTKAVSDTNGKVTFWQSTDYKGTSSLYEYDFKDNKKYFNQEKINVDSIRLDDFCKSENIDGIDLLCMDLQGGELKALKGLGELLNNVKYIITEVQNERMYYNSVLYVELIDYLKKYNFKVICDDLSIGEHGIWGNALFERINK